MSSGGAPRVFFGASVACTLLALAPAASGANTFYVATDGNDAASGLTWTSALASISNGIAHAGPGDTVMVSNGTYVLAATITVASNITLASVNGPGVTIVNANASEVTGRRNVLTVSGVGAVVQGFTLTGGYAWSGVGGVNMTAGTLRNCIVSGNSANYAASGVGIAVPSGSPVVESCMILSNFCRSGGGGSIVQLASGVMRNCLVARNYLPTAGYGGGDCCAGVAQSAGSLVNCTIAGNWVVGANVGGLLLTGGAVSNSIIYYNRNPKFPATDPASDWNVRMTAGTITNSCLPPGIADAGNVTNDPQFVNPSGGDYRLLPGSPAIDAAIDVGLTTDLDGNPRPTDGDGNGSAAPDMGCCEAAAANSGALRCSFVADKPVAIAANTAVFSARLAGANTNITSYNWNLGNGQFAQGSVVTGRYPVGAWTATLTVTNDASASASVVRSNYIYVAPATVCVDTNGSGLFPFDTWAKAATNLQDGIDVAAVTGEGASTVLARDGTYVVTYCSPIQMYKACRVASANGPAVTVINRPVDANTYRMVEFRNGSAVLDGFTITNGFMGTSLQWNYLGGGVRVYAGTIQNCLVINCQAGGSGGGILLDSGLVDRCRIVNNRAANCYSVGGGGGILMYGGIVRNSLVANNTAGIGSAYGNGGGISMWNAGCRVENCTVVGNIITNATVGAAHGGAGIYRRYDSDAVTNSIVWYNVKAGQPSNITNNGTRANIGYTCSPDVTQGANGNTTNDPLFVSFDDYRTQQESPCWFTGTYLDWMAGATDLDGAPRVSGQRVDMGAYQHFENRGSIITVR